ncbi:MAG: hypothetical protein QXT14_04780 [Candidatus Bathyarchaeia archaeon]
MKACIFGQGCLGGAERHYMVEEGQRQCAMFQPRNYPSITSYRNVKVVYFIHFSIGNGLSRRLKSGGKRIEPEL